MPLDAKRIMNGTWGELWLDGVRMTEVSRFQAQDNLTYETVQPCGTLRGSRKLMSIDGSGTLSLYKVNSKLQNAMRAALSQGKDPRFTVMAKLDDPDAAGAEYYAFYGVAFDTAVYMNWQAGTLQSDDLNFTYDYFEAMQTAGDA